MNLKQIYLTVLQIYYGDDVEQHNPQKNKLLWAAKALIFTFVFFNSTVESRLSDLNETEGWLDNQKCQIIQKANENNEGKY
jgi:hypothetical protein